MGLYDYLNGEQVKCFPAISLFIEKEGNKDVLKFWESGGSLKSFSTYSKVPYATPYYNYGQDFLVFDYEKVEEDGYDDHVTFYLHEVKDGLLSGSYPMDDIPHNLDYKLTLDYRGRPVKVSSTNDLFNIKDDFDRMVKGQYFTALSKLREKYPDYIVRKMTGNVSYIEMRNHDMDLKNIIDTTFNAFKKKWLSDDYYYKSNKIGVIVDYMLNEDDDCRLDKDVVELYKKQSQHFKDDMDEYREWLKANNHSQKDEILELINTWI